MKMTHINMPEKYNRNAPRAQERGVENTGSILIKLSCDLAGISDLADMDVLDVGCGVRFTQTIINRDISIKSYTGIDINKNMMEYLINNVHDSRFYFYYWNVYNESFNQSGEKLSKAMKLPLPSAKKFDLIWMFSVITHINPTYAESMFSILRNYVKENGCLFFSAFIDNKLDSFESRKEGRFQNMVYYSEKFMTQILSKTGWNVKSTHDKDPEKFIQNHFVCTPQDRL